MQLTAPKRGRPPSRQLIGLDRDALMLREELQSAYDRCQAIVATGDRSAVRQMHLSARLSADGFDRAHMVDELMRHATLFPNLEDIDVARIAPRLVLVVEGSDEARIFRLCRATWSLPPNKGYGRRLRFLVVDDFHEAVIGIIGLQSPPADLACRDQLLGCKKEDKLLLVNATMDAYAVGAVGAYRSVLGGKLVAGLLSTNEVREAYWRIYGRRVSEMLGKRHAQPLLAVTTTSAYGRSSIYNRVRFGVRTLAEHIGATKGYGTLHVESLYDRITAWLDRHGKRVPSGFGNGPKVRWQNVQNALMLLKLEPQLLRHGLSRDVYLFRHVENLEAVAQRHATPVPWLLSANQYAEYWRDRWALPRRNRLELQSIPNALEEMVASIEGLTP